MYTFGWNTYNKQYINQVFKGYYLTLYKSELQEDKAITEVFLSKLNVTKLTWEQFINLDKPHSNTEVLSAIRNIHKNKAPGPDDISIELYSLMTRWVAKLTHIYYDIITDQQILTSVRNTLITLLLKTGKSGADVAD